jgi:FAD/FMN-containing dehydrogenase
MAIALRNETISRRGFLAGSSALVAGAGLAASARWAPVRAQARPPSDAAWRELADKISGPVLRASSFNLAQIAAPYNLRYAADLPDGIALCRTPEDVSAAITWCNENRFPLVVQCAGHSYAGYSMRNGGLMINLLLMRAAKIGGDSVTVAGGMRNQDLYGLLEQRGAAITHGRCPTVGAAGFLLGGGIGFNMRGHGLACDQLVESQIVTADGNIRTISPQATGIDGDLYWASRGGGGGNFGVNTSFTLRTFAAEPMTVFLLTWTAATPDPDKVALALIPALESAPVELDLGTRMSFGAPRPSDRALGRNVTINLIGQLRGTRRTLDDLLVRAYGIAKPQQAMVWENAPYWAAQKLLEETDPPLFFHERSVFVAKGEAEKAVAANFHRLRAWPGTSVSADLRFFQTGGRMNDTAPTATAFVHRNSEWIMDVGLNWSGSDPYQLIAQNRTWQDRFYDAIRPFSTGGAYQNFADPSLRDWRDAYYRENLERLERIKKQVDPGRLFDFPQAI